MNEDFIIQMLHITKKFPGIIANNDITLELRRGEIHALLGENGAGKSTLMSILFGLYQPEEGEIKKNGQTVKIKNPNDATALGIGMVHQHFKLVDVFTVLDNIILGCEPQKYGLIDRKVARQKIESLTNKYGLKVDLDAKIEDISVGMQQRVEILKMLYRDNEILIFDEPTAVLTPQEIDELMNIMRNLVAEGKTLLFITHKLNEIMAVSDRCSVLCKGRYIGTVDIKDTTKEELSKMMTGRDVKFNTEKSEPKVGNVILEIKHLNVANKTKSKLAVKDACMQIHSGEVVAIAGIDGNGQTDFINALTGLDKPCNVEQSHTQMLFDGVDILNHSIRQRSKDGISHIPEDRHKHGLVLDYSLEQNTVLQRYWQPDFEEYGFIKNNEVSKYSQSLQQQFDIRSSQGNKTVVRTMSGGNQQKAIIAREIDKKHKLLIAVQPTRGLDVGAIEYIHKHIIDDRNNGAGVLLVSYELDEVFNLADRILVMYEGEFVGQLDPKTTTKQELGLYMAGAKKNINNVSQTNKETAV